MSAPHPRPFAVDPAEYPFEDHWFERDGAAMPYVDHGTGTAVVMLHGNPTWSFLYRHVIKQLSGDCRSIAPDYPGFGFSDHPKGYGYSPQEHAQWIAALIDHLRLDRFVLVVQDWGGPIEIVWAMRDMAFGWESYLRRWLAHFPDTPVDRIADAGHYLQEDRPDRIVAAVRRVLEQIG